MKKKILLCIMIMSAIVGLAFASPFFVNADVNSTYDGIQILDLGDDNFIYFRMRKTLFEDIYDQNDFIFGYLRVYRYEDDNTLLSTRNYLIFDIRGGGSPNNSIAGFYDIDSTWYYGKIEIDERIIDSNNDLYIFVPILVNNDTEDDYILSKPYIYNYDYPYGDDYYKGFEDAFNNLSATSWIKSTFGTLGDILNMPIFGKMTIGTFIAVPLLFGLLGLLFKIWRRD